MPNTTPTSAARTVELYQFQGGGLVPLLVRCSAGDVADIEAMIAAAVAAHNTDPEAHPDIRQALKEAGGGLVTAPVLTLAERLPIGAAATLGMAAQAGLVGAHVARFDVTVNDAEPVSVAAADGAAEYAFTPAGNAGDTVSVRVVATDNFGNRSREATARATLYEKSGLLLASSNKSLLASVDDGASWTTRASTTYYISKLTQASDNVLLGYTSTNSIVRSTDKGTTWSVCYTDTTNMTNIVAFEDGLAFCTSSGSYLFRSTDYGSTWKKISLPTSASTGTILSLNDDALLLVQSTGTQKDYVYHSVDDGASWTARCTWTPGESGARLGTAVKADDGSIVGGSSSGAVRSIDNGASWTTTLFRDNTGINSFYQAFFKFPSGELFLFIRGYAKYPDEFEDTVYRSGDNGVSWEVTHDMDALLFPNSYAMASSPWGDVYVGDRSGRVHHRAPGAVSWTTRAASEISILTLAYLP